MTHQRPSSTCDLRPFILRRLAQTCWFGACFLLLVLPATAEIGPGFLRYSVSLDEGLLSYVLREGSGPGLVLIPGSFVDSRDWSEVITRLDPALRIMVVELRGHGKSWPPPVGGSVEKFAEDVLRAVDHAGLDRFYVGGHSIGGMIAIEIGGRCPERLKGVISVEGWTHHSVLQDAFLGRNENTLCAAQMARKAELRKPVMTRWSQQQVAEFAAIWKKWNGFDILLRTSLPILEVWGDRGRARPSLEKMMIPGRSNIEVRWIAGASHFLPMERPAEVARAIQEFVCRVESAESDTGSHKVITRHAHPKLELGCRSAHERSVARKLSWLVQVNWMLSLHHRRPARRATRKRASGNSINSTSLTVTAGSGQRGPVAASTKTALELRFFDLKFPP